jgi:CheY-like chemotaxis protein
MGGTLDVRSESGHGAEFIFTVPLDEADVAPKESDATPTWNLDATFASRHPLRILTVEDDKINLKLILALLRRLGYEPLGAMNGREATEVHEKEHPDCILMDLQMPEMDGIEATEKIRGMEKDFPNGHPVFIAAVTANIIPADRQRCFDAGMNDYMNKPVRIDALAALLAKAGCIASHGAAEKH